MYSKYIEVPRKLTSYEFYNNLLLQKRQLNIENNQEIVLDFSKTDSIEPLTIPNLLCLGYEIRRTYYKTAIIYIPETSSSRFKWRIISIANCFFFTESFIICCFRKRREEQRR